MSKRHKDLEFHVRSPRSIPDRVMHTFEDAAVAALILSVQEEAPVFVDVIVYSAGAAKVWLGDDGRDMYLEDPDTSVFERIEIKAKSHGRVP